MDSKNLAGVSGVVDDSGSVCVADDVCCVRVKDDASGAVTGVDLRVLSDRELIDLCQKCGKNAKMWLRKFAVLLPEVFKRGLYRRRGFASIHEFAAKVAGMGQFTVDQILSLDRVLDGKPVLRSLIEEYGWSKVRVVAGCATSETDAMWADKVKILPKSALEVYVRGIKMQRDRDVCGNVDVVGGGVGGRASEGGLFVGETVVGDGLSGKNGDVCVVGGVAIDAGGRNLTCNSFPGERKLDFADEIGWSTMSIKIDPKTEFKLRLLKQKIEKERKEKISFGELFKVMVEEIENVQENEKAGKKVDEKSGAGAKKIEVEKPNYPSRYIPANIKKYLHEKYGEKCGFPGCGNPAVILHHTKRYSLYGDHDPSSIVPLCKDHHDIAHGALISGERDEPGEWKLSENQICREANYLIDEMFRERRKR